MNFETVRNLLLLLSPIILIQLGLAVYSLVDLSRRTLVHGPRWLWAVGLIITALAVPTGIILSALYLVWGRQVEA
jgi:hypothetical protein